MQSTTGRRPAERAGFEPAMELSAPYSLSRRVPSATRPPLRADGRRALSGQCKASPASDGLVDVEPISAASGPPRSSGPSPGARQRTGRIRRRAAARGAGAAGRGSPPRWSRRGPARSVRRRRRAGAAGAARRAVDDAPDRSASSDWALLLARHAGASRTPQRRRCAGAFAAAAARRARPRPRAPTSRPARSSARPPRRAPPRRCTSRSTSRPCSTRICREALAILDADIAAVYRGTPSEGLHVARHRTARRPRCRDPARAGHRAGGQGAPGPAADAHQRLPAHRRAARRTRRSTRSHASLRRSRRVGRGAARHRSRSATRARTTSARTTSHCWRRSPSSPPSRAATPASTPALAQAARTDALTGCLNHAALHDSLLREIERAARVAEPRAVADPARPRRLQAGQRGARPPGRRRGAAPRRPRAARRRRAPTTSPPATAATSSRSLAVEADEEQAAEIAARAIERVGAARGRVRRRRARRRDGRRRRVGAGADRDAADRPRRPRAAARQAAGRPRRGATSSPSCPSPSSRRRFEPRVRPRPGRRRGRLRAWPDSRDEAGERLRKRTRQLALANALGTRLSAMTDVEEILDAVVEELHRAFGYYLLRGRAAAPRRPGRERRRARRPFLALASRELVPAPRRRPDRPLPARGPPGRRRRRRRRPRLPPDAGDARRSAPSSSSRCTSAGELWGVLNVEELEVDAFDEDDVRLMETMADQAGSALRSASLYEQLERAYLGTAEALAAALEAKDSYTANHARSIVEHAEAVGRRLGMDARQLRDLRFGAVFHDIGKIAVPEQILNKRGPADRGGAGRGRAPHGRRRADPRARSSSSPARGCWCATSTSAGTAHGYPDGLAGDDIPLGSRIILACDALHAMTSDRPYRRAMSGPAGAGGAAAQRGHAVRPAGRGGAARRDRRGHGAGRLADLASSGWTAMPRWR